MSTLAYCFVVNTNVASQNVGSEEGHLSVAQEVLIDIAEEMAEEVAAEEQIDTQLTAAATEGAMAVTPDLDETEALLGHPDRDKSPEPGVNSIH